MTGQTFENMCGNFQLLEMQTDWNFAER